MEQLVLLVAFLTLLGAVAGMIYPFKPFGKRRNALFTFIASMLVVFAAAPQLEEEDRTVDKAVRSEGSETKSENLDREQAKHGEVLEKRVKLQKEVQEAVEGLEWSLARSRFLRLSSSDLSTDEFKEEIEARMLELVKPLPASDHESNLKGYKFLAAIRPDNPLYGSKITTYEEAIKAARQRAVNILKRKEDRVEGVTWYKHPNQPKYLNSRSTAYLYIGKSGTVGRPWLRMKVQYASSDWLFVKRVIAWHDGIKEPLISGNFERDNNSTIWEWMDVTPDDYQVAILRSLANANEAILRFEGDQYRKDVKLSGGDKKAIREVLRAYEVMQSEL